MTLTTLVTVSAALLSVPFMIYIEINYPSSLNAKSLLSIFYLGLFPTAIAFQLRFHIISKAGPIFLSYVAYLIPAFAILWGYLFLNEKINLDTLIGVILILIGVFISQKNIQWLK
jgi:drug/metabolite transporter (DMT)-like permease